MSEKTNLIAKTHGSKDRNIDSKPKKPDLSQPIHSPIDQILHLQRTIGNQAVQRLFKSGIIQTRLKIGQTGDIYEQEADRVADQVIRMPEPKVQRQPFESNTQSLRGSGKPLPESTRNFFESHFGYDFNQVRIHTDTKAANTAEAINAQAFTVGEDIVFGAGHYSPETKRGKRLLAHELTHVVQQKGASERPQIQRLEVRLPVFEEMVTQISTVEALIHGRYLNRRELALARPIFGNSIDYARVRLIPTPILEWRTVGNTIRVPKNFTIRDASMAETFIHEMTHVWQYQHGGTSYISTSLSDQIVGAIRTGSRNAAYKYQIVSKKSFFEYRPEQQASIVERYFAMLREQSDPNTTSQRRSQISRELSLHQPLINQMSTALLRREIDILRIRVSEVMQTPGLLGQEAIPPERRLAPIPILEIRF